ncbi:MAG: choice-of-anchor B family protein [Bacteroidota bacterium]
MNTYQYLKFVGLAFLLAFFTQLSAQDCVGGSAGGFPCDDINLKSQLTLSQLGATGDGNDIWGWTDPSTQKEYALMGLNNGTVFVDISDPSNPVRLGNLPTHSSNSLWRDIKVVGSYAYIVSEASNHGMQVFDLTRLRNVNNPPVTFTEDGHMDFGSVRTAHNTVANEEAGFVYLVGTNFYGNGGISTVDISNPTNPSVISNYGSDNYTHDAICFQYRGIDAEHIGKEVCIGSNESKVVILDMTDKDNIERLSSSTYPGQDYVHQAWVTDDHRYLLVNDEQDETGFGRNTRTFLFDISDLDSPNYLGFHEHPTRSIDHNLYVRGRYAFLSNYTAGLRIMDIADIANGNLSEVAAFDLYPENDNASFEGGTWSNYPYFKSGNIVVSTLDRGLFVVEPNFPHYAFTLNFPTTIEVSAGQSKQFVVDFNQYAGFSTPINLNVLNVPSDLTVSLSQNTISNDGQITITVTAAANAGEQNYSLLLEGTGSNASQRETIAMGVKVDGDGGGCTPGAACDDGDACTTNDLLDANCNCAGTFTDADNDGVCVGDDPDDNDQCVPNATDPSCNPTGGGCTTIDNNDFEAGLGIWNLGGNDGRRNRNDGSFANSGTYCVRLRDNSGAASSMFTDNINATSYDRLEFSFSYIVTSFESNEDFFLELSTNGGSSYSAVENWVLSTDFQNDVRENVTVTINGNFTSSTRLRIRCDASNNGDRLFIDDVVIKGCNGVGGGCTPGSACDDGDACTTNDIFDEDCNCAGTFTDADNDGVCVGDDPDDNDPCVPNNSSPDCGGTCTPGATCNDGDDCTTNDVFDADCNCVGTFTDADNDGVCVGDDPDDNDQCVPNATSPDCNSGSTCEAPVGLRATAISKKRATLNWNSVSGANSYDVQYRQVGTSTWTDRNTITLNIRITGLRNRNVYEWRVRANCDDGTTSDWSVTCEFTAGDSSSGDCGAGLTNNPTIGAFDFAAYPNPASDELNIRLNLPEEGTLRMIDVVGRTVLEIIVTKGYSLQNININDLPKGIYFLELKTAADSHIEKVIVE